MVRTDGPNARATSVRLLAKSDWTKNTIANASATWSSARS
jgi:hypothetical protein